MFRPDIDTYINNIKYADEPEIDYSLKRKAKAALVLGMEDEAATYGDLFKQSKKQYKLDYAAWEADCRKKQGQAKRAFKRDLVKWENLPENERSEECEICEQQVLSSEMGERDITVQFLCCDYTGCYDPFDARVCGECFKFFTDTNSKYPPEAHRHRLYSWDEIYEEGRWYQEGRG